MKFAITKKLSYLLLILMALSGLYCTKAEDPIVGWGNKITVETGSTTAPATSSSVTIGGSTISCRVSGLAGKERGICWSESSTGATVSGNKLPVGSGTGSFTATIPGLSPAKTYYYRTYILLAAPSSALYGDLKTFSTPAGCPTFTFTGVATSTTANFVINITSNGGAPVTSCGVVYSSTVTSPIIGQSGCTNAQSTTTPIIGANNISVTGLTQATSYYARAWATNSAGLCYGPVYIVPTGANLATLTTSAVTTFTSTTATLGGNITGDGGTAITQRGVVISSTVSTPSVLNNSPTTGASGCTSFLANPPTGTGIYSIGVTGLLASTTYYVRAWAKNSASTISYGNITSFTTPAQIVCPTMSTAAVTTFTNTTATLGGSITAIGSGSIIQQGVVYSRTNNNPTVGGSGCTFVSYGPTGLGNYSSIVAGLIASTTYYVKACALNNSLSTWCYGNTQQFTTSGSSGGSVTVVSGVIAVGVPDFSSTGASRSLSVTIPSGRTITGISVTFSMTHTWVSDMVFNLKAPNGQTLNLFNRHGTSGINFVNTTVSSTGTANLNTASAPFTNNYAAAGAIGIGPTGGLSTVASFASLYSVGTGGAQTWTLFMRDYASGDIGTLTSWSITVTYN